MSLFNLSNSTAILIRSSESTKFEWDVDKSILCSMNEKLQRFVSLARCELLQFGLWVLDWSCGVAIGGSFESVQQNCFAV